MKKCPKCVSGYMTQHIEIVHGEPIVVYSCENCGYVPESETITYTNRTVKEE